MDNAKVDAVIRQIASELRCRGYFSERADVEQPLTTFPARTSAAAMDLALRHAVWMCEQTLALPPEKLEKKMRWLGFVQGVLWMTGVTTIAEAKRANMPDDEKVDQS